MASKEKFQQETGLLEPLFLKDSMKNNFHFDAFAFLQGLITEFGFAHPKNPNHY